MRPALLLVPCALVLVPPATASPDGGVGLGECTGMAPIETDCDVDVRYLDGSDYLGFSIYPCAWDITHVFLYPMACLVADVQVVAELVDEPATREVWTCRLVMLTYYFEIEEPNGCRSPHPITLVGMAKVTCHARLWGSMVPDVDGGGLPGAIGQWGCFVAERSG